MDKQAQETLLALFRELLAELREGELFDVSQVVSGGWVFIRLSTGTGETRWNVERSFSSDRGLIDLRPERVPAVVADLFDRLRRPGSAS